MLDLGFENVECFQKGEDAWRFLCSQKVDLLLSDWNLEGLSGNNLVQRIKISLPWDFPIIVFADRISVVESHTIHQCAVTHVLPHKAGAQLCAMAISWPWFKAKNPQRL